MTMIRLQFRTQKIAMIAISIALSSIALACEDQSDPFATYQNESGQQVTLFMDWAIGQEFDEDRQLVAPYRNYVLKMGIVEDGDSQRLRGRFVDATNPKSLFIVTAVANDEIVYQRVFVVSELLKPDTTIVVTDQR